MESVFSRSQERPAQRQPPPGRGAQRGLPGGARILAWAGAAALATTLAVYGPRYLRAASVLLATMGQDDPSGLTAVVTGPVTTREVQWQMAAGPITARVYQPARGEPRGGILLVHGIHPKGMDEPRFGDFARAMAAVGNLVVTPSLPELASLEATPQSVTRIARAAASTAQWAGRPIVLIGVSVGGGLALLAAIHPELPRSAVGRVVAIGAHHDLVRVARHYAGVRARGTHGQHAPETPHHYGIQVLAYAHADRLFAPSDVTPARTALSEYLHQRYSKARALLPELSEPGQALLSALLSDPEGALVQQRLRKAISEIKPRLRAVSPASRLDRLRVPAMLLHGTDDSVIPPTEMSWLAREIPEDLLAAQLATPLLSHVDFPKDAGPGDFAALVSFVAAMLVPP